MYATDRDDMHCCFTFKCIVSSPPYMENGSLGSLRRDTRAQGEETSMIGSLGMCRAHSFLRPLLLSYFCMVQVYGIFKFKKIIQFHNLASLNRVAILLQFALNRVGIEAFQQHSPNHTSFKSSPGEVFSLIHNDNSAKTAQPVFSRVKNEKKYCILSILNSISQ